MELPELIYRLVGDASLRNCLKSDPERAVKAAGINLSQEELEALADVPWEASLSTLLHPTLNGEAQGPDGWWVSQFSHCHTQPRPSMTA